MKPYEVEILVAQVGGESGEEDELYHILYDGTVMDEEGSTVLGGQAETIADALEHATRPSSTPAPRSGSVPRCSRVRTRSSPRTSSRSRSSTARSPRRAFRRIKGSELIEILAAG